MEIASTCLRVLIFGVGYILFSMIFFDSVLIRCRKTNLPWMILGIIWAGKTILLDYIVRMFWGNQLWFPILKISYLMMCSILMCTIFLCYMYRGSVLKIASTEILCEANYAVILGAVLTVINSLEGREEPMGYVLPFMLPDLLTLPVLYGFIKLEIRFLRPLLSWIRTYEPKHRKTGWMIVGGYFILSIMASYQGAFKRNIFNSWNIFPVFVVVIFGTVMVFWISVQYRKKTEQKNSFLYSQANLMESYLQLLKQQMPKIKSNREDAQIDQISIMAEQIQQREVSASSQEKLRKYIESLKGKYEEIQAGVYCNDWLVDVVLFYMARFCRENDMKISFSFQTYDRGEIEEEDIAEIIYQLLTYGAKESQLCRKKEDKKENVPSLSLQAAAVKNQLILNSSFYSGKSLKKLKRELKRNLSEKIDLYHGEIIVSEIKGEEKQISIRIQREKK